MNTTMTRSLTIEAVSAEAVSAINALGMTLATIKDGALIAKSGKTRAFEVYPMRNGFKFRSHFKSTLSALVANPETDFGTVKDRDGKRMLVTVVVPELNEALLKIAGITTEPAPVPTETKKVTTKKATGKKVATTKKA